MCQVAQRAVRARHRLRSPSWATAAAAIWSSTAPPAAIRPPASRAKRCRQALGAWRPRSRAPDGRKKAAPTRSLTSAQSALPQSLEGAMTEPLAYLREGAAIYERSFAIIRAEADLSAFSADAAEIVVRMIHACGVVEAARHIAFGGDLIGAARRALASGAPILCDAEMVAHGITRARLPAHNEVVCTLRDARVGALAAELGTTRSAAALELWRDRLAGAVV